MAADFAELALEGVPLVTEHYDKVYDPVKDKTKQGIRKVKEMRDKRNGGYESESEEYDYDGPPARRSTTGGGGSKKDPRDYDRRTRSSRYDDIDDDGFVTEERRHVKGPPRAKSVGRDGRGDRRGGKLSPLSFRVYLSLLMALRTTFRQAADVTTLIPSLPSLLVHAVKGANPLVKELSLLLAWPVPVEPQPLKSLPGPSPAAVASALSAATTALAAVTEATALLAPLAATLMTTTALLRATSLEATLEMKVSLEAKLHDAIITPRSAPVLEVVKRAAKRKRREITHLPDPPPISAHHPKMNAVPAR